MRLVETFLVENKNEFIIKSRFCQGLDWTCPHMHSKFFLMKIARFAQSYLNQERHTLALLRSMSHDILYWFWFLISVVMPKTKTKTETVFSFARSRPRPRPGVQDYDQDQLARPTTRPMT